jgi:hypothetical protein
MEPTQQPAAGADKEMEGLRAFQVRVGCYSGGRHAEEPRWVEREGLRLEVAAIDSRWREQDRLGFRVTLEDSQRLLLYYLPEEDIWSAVEVS